MDLLPNLFCIGGMRCGSTTLHHILGQHPDIFMSETKEPMFWKAEADRQAGTWQPDGGRYRTTAAYGSLFEGTADFRWRGESSHYLYFPDVARLIAQRCPDSRILISLREPAGRLFSEYLLHVRSVNIDCSFETFAFADTERILTGEISSIGRKSRLAKGLQAKLIEPWVDEFGKERVKIVFFEDLQAKPTEMTRQLFTWLEVDNTLNPNIFHMQKGGVPYHFGLFTMLDRRGGSLRSFARNLVPPSWRNRVRETFYNVSLDRPNPTPETMEILRAYYRPDVERLEDLLQRDLSHWKNQPGCSKAPCV